MFNRAPDVVRQPAVRVRHVRAALDHDDFGLFVQPTQARRARCAAGDAAKAKVEQCKEAQDRYQRYVDSRRLFRVMPDGKRQYLTDQELTDARARAKQAVDDYCS